MKIKIVFLNSLIFSSILYASQITMLEKACKDKKGAACEELGLLYTEGIGFEKNATKANQYYEKACKYGATTACEKIKFI